MIIIDSTEFKFSEIKTLSDLANNTISYFKAEIKDVFILKKEQDDENLRYKFPISRSSYNFIDDKIFLIDLINNNSSEILYAIEEDLNKNIKTTPIYDITNKIPIAYGYSYPLKSYKDGSRVVCYKSKYDGDKVVNELSLLFIDFDKLDKLAYVKSISRFFIRPSKEIIPRSYPLKSLMKILSIKNDLGLTINDWSAYETIIKPSAEFDPSKFKTNKVKEFIKVIKEDLQEVEITENLAMTLTYLVDNYKKIMLKRSEIDGFIYIIIDVEEFKHFSSCKLSKTGWLIFYTNNSDFLYSSGKNYQQEVEKIKDALGIDTVSIALIQQDLGTQYNRGGQSEFLLSQ